MTQVTAQAVYDRYVDVIARLATGRPVQGTFSSLPDQCTGEWAFLMSLERNGESVGPRLNTQDTTALHGVPAAHVWKFRQEVILVGNLYLHEHHDQSQVPYNTHAYLGRLIDAFIARGEQLPE